MATLTDLEQKQLKIWMLRALRMGFELRSEEFFDSILVLLPSIDKEALYDRFVTETGVDLRAKEAETAATMKARIEANDLLVR